MRFLFWQALFLQKLNIKIVLAYESDLHYNPQLSEKAVYLLGNSTANITCTKLFDDWLFVYACDV